MMIRGFVTVAVLANAAIGSLCMMPMAMAHSMPMQQHDDVTEAMEMTMTPMETMSPIALMSPADCVHCVHVEKVQPNPMSSGCAGSCLSPANDTGPTVASNSVPMLFVASLPSTAINVMNSGEAQSFVEANAPPAQLDPGRTTVLLL